MFAIMGRTANGPEAESNLQTIQAANNRLRMLNRRYPNITFWIEPVTPAAESACEKTLVMERIR